MPEYRRNRVEAGTYFFTSALADRRSFLLVRVVAALRISVSRARALYPFRFDAWLCCLGESGGVQKSTPPYARWPVIRLTRTASDDCDHTKVSNNRLDVWIWPKAEWRLLGFLT
jgi:hypothetical protein